jgi:hypothetical protein
MRALRTRDLAAWSIVKTGGAALPFITDGPANDWLEELDAVRRFIRDNKQ